MIDGTPGHPPRGHRSDPPGGARPRRRRRFVAILMALCLALSSGFAIVLPAAPAAATGNPDISLSKSAPGSVLVGEPVTYTLTVTNPADAVPAYNLSLRDVLPAGMT